jgi:hypothetical protein
MTGVSISRTCFQITTRIHQAELVGFWHAEVDGIATIAAYRL